MSHYASSLPATLWVGRFGAQLMLRLPSLDTVHAVRRAVATWPYASHLEPEEAADVLCTRFAGLQRSHQLETP